MAAPDDNLIGDLPGRYSDVRRLGEGAEGGTWLAREGERGRIVVLKPLRGARYHAVRGAFHVLRRVNSPHLPAVLELLGGPGFGEGRSVLVTAWVEGEILAAGPVSPRQAISEALGVAHALRAIHGVGTHHGDVSAANVVVTPTRGVVLTDLGQVGGLGSGTPGYLAPEVLAGGGGPAADRFALACLLCLRLFGQVPWRDPESLLRVRGRSDVRGRLDQLALAAQVEISPALSNLLAHLLDPQPAARMLDSDALVRRLRQLERAAADDLGGISLCHWWLPTRWAYVGPDLAPTLRRLGGTRGHLRVVAVCGPRGAGRGRVVEELVHGLQAAGTTPAAALCDAESLAPSLSDLDPDHASHPAGRELNWVEAWLAAGPGQVGVRDELPWPVGLESPAMRAAVLREGAALSGTRLIVSVDAELGTLLEEDGSGRICVVQLGRWSPSRVRGIIEELLEGGDPGAWAAALVEATGGWPARVVRTIEACAAQGVEVPDPRVMSRALTEFGARTSMPPDEARRVLEAYWGVQTEELTGALGVDHVHHGRVRGWALAAARATIADRVETLAAASIELVLSRGQPVSIELAIDSDTGSEGDAEGPARVCAALREVARRGGDLPATLMPWLEARPGTRAPRSAALDVEARAVVARQLLRDGEPQRTLALLGSEDGPECVVLRARSLQQLGRSEEALVLLGTPTGPEARGIRWRALIDLGRAVEAWAEASSWISSACTDRIPASGHGLAVACLWAAYAAMQCGDEEAASACLERSSEILGEASGREAQGLRARIHQLAGNLAHAHGDGLLALSEYRQAAAAFRAAGEVMGRVLLEGSLAGLAFQAGELGEALDRGRAAVRGLVARGHVQALPAALFNLVQGLCLVDAADEGRRLEALVRGLCGAVGEVSPLAAGRLARVRAELDSVGAGPVGAGDDSPVSRRAAQRESAEAMEAVAISLAAAGAPREAGDAWLRAATFARRAGDSGGAARALDEARACVDLEDGDLGPNLALCIEGMVQASTTESQALATGALARFPGPAALVQRGETMAAWAYDRALLFTLQRQYSPKHRICAAVAERQIGTLEVIMSKTQTIDRDALRNSLLREAGDPEPLRALVRTLEADAAALAPSARSPGSPEGSPGGLDDGGDIWPDERDVLEGSGGGQRADRATAREANAMALLRVFRRVSREDSLDRLLEQLVEAMMEITGAERGVVSIGSGDERVEVAREFAAQGEGVRYSRSVIDRVREDGEPVISVDAAADDRFDQSRSVSHLNLRSVLAVPLIFRGEALGAVYVDHRLRRGAFDEDDLARLEDFAGLAALAVAHARALAALRGQAHRLQAQQEKLAELLEARELEVEGLREAVRSQVSERRCYRGILGGSSAMQRIYKLIDRLGGSSISVVIHGESGTGKELVARAIHDAGPRSPRPFVAENCGAIPETLFESVLFGHARGAFTGAVVAKAGLFEAADGGTIFLDEIGEMSLSMQTKLLRVLQESEIRRVGENHPRSIDVRVIAASNRDLEAMVKAGTFRQDLFYRIDVVRVDMPALRERCGDIPDLVSHFLERHGGEHLRVSAAVLRKLSRYPWPGNVRELENEVLRWIALVEDLVTPDDLGAAILDVDGDVQDPDDLQLRPRIERLEREIIARALQRTGGNQTQAAGLLGLSRYGLQKKLRRLNDEGGAST